MSDECDSNGRRCDLAEVLYGLEKSLNAAPLLRSTTKLESSFSRAIQRLPRLGQSSTSNTLDDITELESTKSSRLGEPEKLPLELSLDTDRIQSELVERRRAEDQLASKVEITQKQTQTSTVLRRAATIRSQAITKKVIKTTEKASGKSRVVSSKQIGCIEIPESCSEMQQPIQQQPQQHQFQEQQQQHLNQQEMPVEQDASIQSLSMKLQRAASLQAIASQHSVKSSGESSLAPMIAGSQLSIRVDGQPELITSGSGSEIGLGSGIGGSCNQAGFDQMRPLPVCIDAPANCQPGEQRPKIELETRRLAKMVSKKAARMKEVLLQNLGKSERTSDQLFDLYEQNFNKQLSQAARLQKEFKSYLAALDQLQTARSNLGRCIRISTAEYAPLVARHDLMCDQLCQLESLGVELSEQLRAQPAQGFHELVNQFADLRKKIAKRQRKLIDFDGSRRQYELAAAKLSAGNARVSGNVTATGSGIISNLSHQESSSQSQSPRQLSLSPMGAMEAGEGHDSDSISATGSRGGLAELVDEARMLKLREQLNYARVCFETLNGELHSELPEVYERKLRQLLDTLQATFSIEAQFHSEASQLLAKTLDLLELPGGLSGGANSDEGEQQATAIPATGNDRSITESNKRQQVSSGAGSSGMGSSRGSSAASMADEAEDFRSEVDDQTGRQSDSLNPLIGQKTTEIKIDSEGALKPEVDKTTNQDEEDKDTNRVSEASGKVGPAVVAVGELAGSAELTNRKSSCHRQQVPLSSQEGASDEIQSGRQLEELGETNTLYQVRASYKYLAEDVDELCFEVGEIISVVKLPAGQEVEDGWLWGVREVNGQRGLFPANFTEPL